MKKDRKLLERVLELKKADFYFKGIRDEKNQIIESRVKDSNEYDEILKFLKADYRSFKKGDKILIIMNDNPPKTRKEMFKNITDKNHVSLYSIHECIVHQPLKTRIKKHQWVGDGYEDVEVTTFKYIDGDYIVTEQFTESSTFMIKIN